MDYLLVKNIETQEYKFIQNKEFDDKIYINRNRIQYLHEIGTKLDYFYDKNKYLKVNTDYCFIRDIISFIMTDSGGFNNLKNNDKDIALIYTRNVSDADGITYLMNQGIPLQNAQFQYILYRTEDINQASNSYGNRSSDNYLKALVIKYLGQEQSETFSAAIRNFVLDLKETAILGTNYGNFREGIMDYLEGTAGYEGKGLRNYFAEYNDYLACLKELKDFLYWGYET